MQDIRGMRVLVTGGGGMIGGAVVRLLASRSAQVHAHLGPVDAAVAQAPNAVRTSWADLADRKAATALVGDATAVVHLAGPPSVAASFGDPSTYAQVHMLGTAYLLEACRAAGVKRFCYVSSAEVYGQPRSNPVSESARTVPRSPYGAVKLGTEMLVRSFCLDAGVQAVILRPFSVYGPHSPPWSLVGTVLRQALNEPQVTVASISPIRDFVQVDDVAVAVARSLTVRTVGPAVFNVGSGKGTSVEALVQHALLAAGRNVPIVLKPLPDRPRGGDLRRLVADTRGAEKDLRWRATTPLAAGISVAARALKAGG